MIEQCKCGHPRIRHMFGDGKYDYCESSTDCRCQEYVAAASSGREPATEAGRFFIQRLTEEAHLSEAEATDWASGILAVEQEAAAIERRRIQAIILDVFGVEGMNLDPTHVD